MSSDSETPRRAVVHQIDSQQYASLNKLLDQVLELPEQDRAAWLAQQPIDEKTRSLLIQLLLSDQESSQLPEIMPQIVDLKAIDSPFSAEQKIGQYTLHSRIGVGGMGEVWRALPSDGLLKRAVALKLTRAGLLDDQLLARFSFERDSLAQLNHPNIARLYDAGYEGTQPFMAIELVDGIPITQHCHEKKLDLKQRITLFVQVIDAIQYAHNNLLIHRDIKPSNILVTNEGQVKLIDFGIAKRSAGQHARAAADGNNATEQQTQFNNPMYTPLYASPEQVLGQPINTSTDIYSLGVVLYVLLTGTPPFAKTNQSAEIKSATRPSATVISDEFSETLQLSAKALKRSLADGLDSVLLTAIAQEPSKRYTTARLFSDDLHAWLDGKPVTAVPPSRWYYFRKFALRHPLGMSLGTIAICAVSGAAVVAQIQATKAKAEAQKASQVTQFLTEMLTANSGRSVSTLGAQANRAATAEQLLNAAIEKIQKKSNLSVDLQQNLLGVVGDLTHELQMNDQAIQLREQRVGLLTGAADKAGELLRLSDTLFQAGKSKEVDPVLKRSRELIETLPSEQQTRLLARLQMREGRQLDLRTQFKESVPLLQQAATVLGSFNPPDPDWLEAQKTYLDGLITLDPKTGLDGYEKLVKDLAARHGGQSVELLSVLSAQASHLARLTKFEAAQLVFDQVNAIYASNPAYDPAGAVLNLGAFSVMLRNSGQVKFSNQLLEKSLKEFERLGLQNHPVEPTATRLTYSSSLISQWKFSEAKTQLERVQHVWRNVASRPPSLATALELQARSEMLLDNTVSARDLLNKAKSLREQSLGANHPTLLINESVAIQNEAIAGNEEQAITRYLALQKLPVPASGGAAAFYLGEAKQLSLAALVALKRWEMLVTDSQPIVDKAPPYTLAKLRHFTILSHRLLAFTELKNTVSANQTLEKLQTLAAELGENLPPPNHAIVLVSKIKLSRLNGASEQTLTGLRNELQQLRANLPEEAASFTRAANQVR